MMSSRNELNAPKWRRGGVQAKNYVLHVAKNEEKTLCGRLRAQVNVSGEPEKDRLYPGVLCFLCARRMEP